MTTVTPVSMLIDVHVLLERIDQKLAVFLEELVTSNEEPGYYHSLSDARRDIRRLANELKAIDSLLRIPRAQRRSGGPPHLKVIK